MNKAVFSLVAAASVSFAGVAHADSRGYGYDNGRHEGWSQGRGNYGRGGSNYDYARVVRVDPLRRQVRVLEPRRECHLETVYDRDYYRTSRDPYYYDRGDGRGSVSATNGAIIGGLIGGAVGNQVGRGDGRRIATVAGALIGAAIGHDAGKRRESDRTAGRYDDRYDDRDGDYGRSREVERCRVRHEERYEERIDGYRVTYEYNGREYTTRMPYDPGRQVRVRVDVFPDEG